MSASRHFFPGIFLAFFFCSVLYTSNHAESCGIALMLVVSLFLVRNTKTIPIASFCGTVFACLLCVGVYVCMCFFGCVCACVFFFSTSVLTLSRSMLNMQQAHIFASSMQMHVVCVCVCVCVCARARARVRVRVGAYVKTYRQQAHELGGHPFTRSSHRTS